MIPVYEPWILPSDAHVVAEVVRSGWISSAGPALGAFEKEWAAYCGMAHGVGVANGTAALELALSAIGLEPGSEVICPTFTIVSCVRAILAADAVPVLVDVTPDTFTMDPDEVAGRVTARTAAILGVHMYGHPFAAESLLAIAQDHGLSLVEDAAEAHGAEVLIDGAWRRCGGVGAISTFSFYANKAITTGEGGMVLAADAETARRVRSVANLAFEPDARFVHRAIGHNYRLTNMQAALGLAQMARIDAILERKRWVDVCYRRCLEGVNGIEFQGSASWARPVPWMVGVVLQEASPHDARSCMQLLRQQGIDCRPFFVGMHQQPVLLERGLFAGESYPVADRLSSRGLYLPSSPTLTEPEIEQVSEALRGILGEPSPPKRAVRREPSPSAPFGSAYADAYDALYAGKDYAGEAASLVGCFSRYAQREVREVLDLGCGTGRHLVELARLGYWGTGVDRSPAMIDRARRVMADEGIDVDFHEGDIASVELGHRFDAVCMLFAVLSYQTGNDEILKVLRNARASLRDGGLLLADIWYGPAVLSCPPSSRRLRFGDGRREWVRWTSSSHKPETQTVMVRYRLDELGDGGVVASHEEQHSLRYFFPQELSLLLELAGLELVACTGWPDVNGPPMLDSYPAMVIARAPMETATP